MMLTWLDPGFCNLFVHLFWGPELLTWDFTQKPRVGQLAVIFPLWGLCANQQPLDCLIERALFASLFFYHILEFLQPSLPLRSAPSHPSHPIPSPHWYLRELWKWRAGKLLFKRSHLCYNKHVSRLAKAWSLLRSSGNIPTVLLVAHSQDDLRGSVISRHHIRRHHEACARCPGQSKVKDLQCAIRLDYYVTGF